MMIHIVKCYQEIHFYKNVCVNFFCVIMVYSFVTSRMLAMSPRHTRTFGFNTIWGKNVQIYNIKLELQIVRSWKIDNDRIDSMC